MLLLLGFFLFDVFVCVRRSVDVHKLDTSVTGCYELLRCVTELDGWMDGDTGYAYRRLPFRIFPPRELKSFLYKKKGRRRRGGGGGGEGGKKNLPAHPPPPPRLYFILLLLEKESDTMRFCFGVRRGWMHRWMDLWIDSGMDGCAQRMGYTLTHPHTHTHTNTHTQKSLIKSLRSPL